MKKVVFGILIAAVLTVLAVSGIAIAQGISRNPATVEPSERTVIVPDQAVDNSPVLERAIFIHYRKGHAKPPEAGKPPKGPKCYDFLGRGVKWTTLPVSYIVHPDLEATVGGAIFAGAETWDAATTTSELFSDTYKVEGELSWDSDAPDGRNELLFGDYPEPNVIAVTVVWGYFSGPPSIRKIIEFDIMFDTDFVWGDATTNPAVMDLQNIATHEIGHGAGLDDVYETACAEVTMYGYSDYGETIKRTLEAPDITGIQTLYGM